MAKQYLEHILQFIGDNDGDIEVDECRCGAFTLSSVYGSEQISFSKSTHDSDCEFLNRGEKDLLDSCNHCINHWGIDEEELDEESDFE